MDEVKVTKNKVVNSFAWKFTERILTQGIGVLVQIVLARIMLPEEFGSLTIILAITNYAALFVQSGLATAIVQNKEIDDLDISTVLICSLSIAGFFYFILFFVSPYIADMHGDPNLIAYIRCFSITLFINAVTAIQTAILTRVMAFKRLFIRSFISTALAGVVAVIMAINNWGVWALIFHNMLGSIFSFIVFSFDKSIKIRLCGFLWEKAKKIYKFSGKILLTNIVTGFYDLLRTMLVGKYYTSEDLAYYNRGSTYAEYVTSSVTNAASSVLLSTFSKKQTEMEELRRMARKSVQVTSFLMIPILVGAALVSEPLIKLVLTNKWIEAAKFLSVFCILRIPCCVANIDSQVYYSLGRSGIKLIYELGLFIANVVMLFITLPISPYAVAIGALVVEYVGCTVLMVISKWIYGYSIFTRMRDICGTIISTGIMIVLIILIKQIKINYIISLALQILIGIISYIVCSLLFNKNLSKYFIQTIKGVLKRK